MSHPAETDQAISELLECGAIQQSGPFAAETSEGRGDLRLPFRGRARALVLDPQGHDEPEECDVLTTDISRTGMSFLHRKVVVQGQQILLSINDVNRLLEVCWCRRVWPDLYTVGCRFVQPTAE